MTIRMIFLKIFVHVIFMLQQQPPVDLAHPNRGKQKIKATFFVLLAQAWAL